MGTRADVALEEYQGQQGLERLRPRLNWHVGGARFTQSEWTERARMRFREAVILEGANVPCELVMDGGG